MTNKPWVSSGTAFNHRPTEGPERVVSSLTSSSSFVLVVRHVFSFSCLGVRAERCFKPLTASLPPTASPGKSSTEGGGGGDSERQKEARRCCWQAHCTGNVKIVYSKAKSASLTGFKGHRTCLSTAGRAAKALMPIAFNAPMCDGCPSFVEA
ncbi:hypothetical protein ASPZODRAFT_19136 [Penicilliopsis zonata CBS 506.65]|uniref:Uncharacterized protein n=1 Tax=Penicilliopsis zonata CBS 506.65 TaxID=1073090 RepID=A0A1L9S9J8_9EURO|nr:hypothetical protein ASPZODRAFT_19136 [Penicilliopsis zonata CBS 506.65]OJJ43834.1 hypothetical protein ASPZODRAFT_19136 [Penicilliopsis zonata CBS 506.65]